MCDLPGRKEATSDCRSASAFVDELVVAVTNGRIYPREHPRTQRSLDALHAALEQLAPEEPGQRLVIGTHEGYLIHQERPMLGASLSAPRILRPLTELEAGGLAFGLGASRDEFQALIALLGRRDLAALGRSAAQQILVAAGVTHIELLPRYAEAQREDGQGESRGQRAPSFKLNVPVQLYQGIVDLLQDSMVKVCRGETLHTDGARGYVEAVLKQLDQDSSSLMNVARYEKYDAFTFGHSIRVCLLALNFARTLTDDPRTLQRIGLAALLHDVGKAWVPFEILHSTGYLTDEQRSEMNKHTLYGGEILLDMDESDPLSVAVAVSHHRTQDANGYPATIHAARLSLGTRIVKICDVYEALTAVRPYKTRMSPTRAFRAMMSQRHHFDPALLRRFIAHTGVYPQGSRVKLADGEIARVLAQTESLARPKVRLERAASGELLHPEDMVEIDLFRGEGAERYQVVELTVDSGE